MISRMIGEGVLGGHQDFPIASETKALDDKLEEALVSLTLDFEGKLVQSLSVQGIFHTFESAWKDFSFSAEWLGACSTSGDFDWYLYRSRPIDVLPCVSAQSFLDSDTVYDTVISWLETNTIRDIAGDVLRDLQSQRSMNREFPSGAFVDHLYALTVRLTERRMGGETTNFYLLKTEITSAHQQVESTANSLAVDLRRTFALRARRSPKRRSSFDESDTSRFSTPSKKRKISLSNTSTPSDDASQSSSPPYALRLSPSPTASVSTAPGDAGVSVAMLRALTKDIKAKYGSSPLAKG
ncbi:hypothetical protein PILCRDRAFT_562896 [Piloderma croceum F 1598]|uniref:Uncharacterized protein n=1 Tax=Piloderma croceum (strain F 1598) TaxID=765440 RepID=A0A0C3AZ69_PILCF|nr:hypothetical protein PILCRDRAFT_562896 [Piloderma croceum F 1598]